MGILQVVDVTIINYWRQVWAQSPVYARNFIMIFILSFYTGPIQIFNLAWDEDGEQEFDVIFWYSINGSFK